MQVVVMGASGFVGQEVVRQALARGLDVFPVVRERALPGSLAPEEAGTLTPLPWGAEPDVLLQGFGLLPGAWIVNAAGLPKERPGQDPRLVHASITREALRLAEGLQARRLVHLGPLLGPDPDPFLRTKGEAEKAIAEARVPWSLLRSAPAFGPGDEFLDEVGAWMLRSPLIPRFLEGVPLEPLWVGDLAQALLEARPGIQEVGGERIPWGELLERCAEAAGKRLLGPRLADATVLRLARAFGGSRLFGGLVPFTEAGLRRHQGGYVPTLSVLPDLLGRPPRPLEDYLDTEWPYRHESAGRALRPEAGGGAGRDGAGAEPGP